MKWKRITAAGMMIVGMVCSFGASLVPRLLPEDTFWDKTQALEHSRASARLHQATFETAGVLEKATATAEEKDHAAQELAAAQARRDHAQAALQRAQFWRSTVPVAVRWVGGFVALLGVVGLLATQSDT